MDGRPANCAFGNRTTGGSGATRRRFLQRLVSLRRRTSIERCSIGDCRRPIRKGRGMRDFLQVITCDACGLQITKPYIIASYEEASRSRQQVRRYKSWDVHKGECLKVLRANLRRRLVATALAAPATMVRFAEFKADPRSLGDILNAVAHGATLRAVATRLGVPYHAMMGWMRQQRKLRRSAAAGVRSA